MRVTPTTVDEYISSAPEDRQAVLRRLRSLIRETVPDAKELMQHGVPYYEFHGLLCAYAAQKQYYSFYVLNGEIVNDHLSLFEGLSVGKGCIRFKHSEQLPDSTVRTLLNAAAEANLAAVN